MGRTVRIGSLLGSEVRLGRVWPIAVAVLLWALLGAHRMADAGLTSGARLGLALGGSSVFLGSLVLHELGHSLVARRMGRPARQIQLLIFGGVADPGHAPDRPDGDLRIALAGPLLSLMLAGLAAGIWRVAAARGSHGLAMTGQWLSLINLSLGLVNLLPGLPLDGGSVLRSLLWRATGDPRLAQRSATVAGQRIGGLLLLAGAWVMTGDSPVDGLWLALGGAALLSAATRMIAHAKLCDILAGHRIHEVMLVDAPTLLPRLTLDVAIACLAAPGGHRFAAVEEHGSFLGLVSLEQLTRVPHAQRRVTQIQDAMIPHAQLRAVRPEDDLGIVFERMLAEGSMALPVVDGTRYAGLLVRDVVVRLMRIRIRLMTRVTRLQTERR